MIENNVIKFGYGTIIVETFNGLGYLKIRYTQPPTEIGRYLSLEESKELETIDEIVFQYGQDMKDLLKQLNQVELYNYKLTFREYVFDFTNYNAKSIEVLSNAIKTIIQNRLMLLAA